MDLQSNNLSKIVQDVIWFVHKRRTCLRKTEEGNLICGKCRPITKNNIVTEKVENFVCNVCNKNFSKKIQP